MSLIHFQLWIYAYEGQVINDGLPYDRPVEWILMLNRKLVECHELKVVNQLATAVEAYQAMASMIVPNFVSWIVC